MSEKFSNQAEQHEKLITPEKLEALPTAAQAEALRAGEKDPLKKLEQARQTVEQNAVADNPMDRLKASEKAQEPLQPLTINRELKSITLRRELQQVQRKLPAPQRVLSRVIHQPVVRAVSEATAKTISRPSGLLGGGFVAFLGSSAYLYFTKHIGVQYNYLVFALLFVGGFVVGLILEFIVWALTARRRSVD
jgi:hypothetical protein